MKQKKLLRFLMGLLRPIYKLSSACNAFLGVENVTCLNEEQRLAMNNKYQKCVIDDDLHLFI